MEVQFYPYRSHRINNWITLSNYMEQRPWKASSRSATQEIPFFLRNPNIRHRFHKSLPLVHILSKARNLIIFLFDLIF
jgi:hypothetical protein